MELMIECTYISSFSCIGTRPNQEDYFRYLNSNTKERVFVLCDGMGGHGHGEIASKTVADAVYDYLTKQSPNIYTNEILQNALDTSLIKLSNIDSFNDTKPMGTTIVVVAINPNNIIVGHIGDSRCYLLSKDSEIKFRSKDHSQVQEAIDAEILTEEEARHNKRKNIITRCILSNSVAVKLEFDYLTIENGDRILICSDGVTDTMNDSQIRSFFIDRPLNKVSQALENNCVLFSNDNASAILIELSQDESIINNTVNATQSQPTTIQCPYCRNIIFNSSQYCSYCGNKISTQLHVTKINKCPYIKEIYKTNRRDIYQIVISLLIFIIIIVALCAHIIRFK